MEAKCIIKNKNIHVDSIYLKKKFHFDLPENLTQWFGPDDVNELSLN